MTKHPSADISMSVERARVAQRTRQLSPDELVEKYTALVTSTGNELARRMQCPVEFEDLLSWGFQGLLEAHGRFKPSAEVTFASYAYHRIRGAMYDGLRKTGWAMRGTAIQIRDSIAINEHLGARTSAFTGAPKAETYGEQVERVADVVGECVTICLLHTADLERVSSAIPAAQSGAIERSELKSALNDAVEQLSETEREVIIRYHLREESMTSIGKALGVSTSWVSRINANAIVALREMLFEREQGWESYQMRC